MKRYKNIRIPVEAYDKEKIRMNEITNKLKVLLKGEHTKPIKMTQYFQLRANKPVFIYDDELINMFSKRKKKGGFSLI